MEQDQTTSVETLKDWIAEFVMERDWEEHHHPKNLVMSIAIEAAELMELFQWRQMEDIAKIKADSLQMERIREELADVLAYCLSMANQLEIDLTTAIARKLEKNRQKYPLHREIDWYEQVKE